MIKLTAVVLLALMPLAPKPKIETISGGVFYVDAYNSQEGVIYKAQKTPHKVMFNMAHILYAEEGAKNTTTITVENGSSIREFLIEMKYEDVMRGIKKTYTK
jgi:hypothetical protein